LINEIIFVDDGSKESASSVELKHTSQTGQGHQQP
jgi:hypothetical protein